MSPPGDKFDVTLVTGSDAVMVMCSGNDCSFCFD